MWIRLLGLTVDETRFLLHVLIVVFGIASKKICLIVNRFGECNFYLNYEIKMFISTPESLCYRLFCRVLGLLSKAGLVDQSSVPVVFCSLLALVAYFPSKKKTKQAYVVT